MATVTFRSLSRFEGALRARPQWSDPTSVTHQLRSGGAIGPQATADGELPTREGSQRRSRPQGRQMPLENCTANTSIFINCRCICNFQATKSQR